MDENKQTRNIEREVPPEDTRPILRNSDEIRQLLSELLGRTEAMEARLERIPPKMQGLYWLADDDDTVETSDTGA